MGGMGAVHLGVVELERQLQRCLKMPPVIFAPDEKRIVENAAVHAHGAVDLGVRKGRGADDHAIGQVVVFTALGRLLRQAQVIGVKSGEIGGKGHVAGGDLAVSVFYNGIHRYGIVLQQLLPHGEEIKLLYLRCGSADAPAKEHIEFQSPPAAEPEERGHVQRLKKRYHGVGRLHPQGKGFGAGGAFRVDTDRFHSARSHGGFPSAAFGFVTTFFRCTVRQSRRRG